MFGLRDLLFDEYDEPSAVAADLALMNSEPEEEILVPEEESEEIIESEEPEPESEPEPEKVSEIHPFDRPSVQAITKEFPEFFKKFPQMRDMYFREREYTKLFPTVDEAKLANDNNSAFQNLQEDIISGDGKKLFSSIKDLGSDKLQKFSGNILTSLFSTDRDAFFSATRPLIQDIARQMFEQGALNGNESQQNAARYLAKYYFSDPEIAEGKKSAVPEVKPADDSVKSERAAWEAEKSQEFRGKTLGVITTEFNKLIDNEKLDPKGVFSPFIKSAIIGKIVDEIDKQLVADKDHMKYMTSLWDDSKRKGRSEESKSRIVSAYLARAKALIPSIRSKYVSEALGQKAKVATEIKEKVTTIQDRRESGTNGKPSNGNGNRKIDYSKTSDEDLLNGKITYK